MPYYENIDQFFMAKIDEQCEIRDHEVRALRLALKEHHEALVKIYKTEKKLKVKGKYHHVLIQFESELDEIFNATKSCLGLGKQRGKI